MPNLPLTSPGRRGVRKRRPTRRYCGRSLDLVAWAAAGVLGGLIALRGLRQDHHRYQIAGEGSRDAVLTFAPLVLAVGLTRRRPTLSAVGLALTIGRLHRPGPATRRPPVSDDGSAQDGGRIVTANLLRGNPRVADLGRELIDDAADIVVLQEVSHAHLTDLRECGLLAAYPHHVIDPTPDFHGSAVLSRWPLMDETVLDVHGFGMAAADVSTPSGPLHVVSVHIVNPAHGPMINTWRDQLTWLAEYVADRGGPVVLAGDFNATVDHRAMQTLLGAGLTDAHNQAGTGLGLTWPQRHWGTGRGRFLPVMRLDHVLITGELSVQAVLTAPSAGSDHRRVIVDLKRPSIRAGAHRTQG